MEIQKATKFNGFTTKGGNYVWAAALGLAWNQIIDKFTQQNIKIDSKDEKILQLVNNFNQAQFSKKDIDERCIYVKSGYGQQTVTTINLQSKKKFPQKSFGDLEIKLGPQDIISYGYLLKKLQFKTKFQLKKNPSFLFCGNQVPSFYASQKKQKSQINHYYYKNKDQFMISIEAKKQTDFIYFIKDKHIESVDEAIQKVISEEKKNPSSMDNIDHFEMPVVDLDVKRDVQELVGKRLLNKKLKNYVFSVVYEAVKLKIDEAGAKVENQAVICLAKSCMMPIKKQPKYFILDKQFWVVMKQKSKHPYFCALIKNPLDK